MCVWSNKLAQIILLVDFPKFSCLCLRLESYGNSQHFFSKLHQFHGNSPKRNYKSNKNSKHQFIYIYIYNLYIPPKNFHTKKSPKTCPLFGVSIQKKQQQLTNGFESCLHRPWLPLRPSFFRLWSHWAFWRPEGVGSAGFLVGGWVPSTKHKGRVKATAATSFTPPKLTWNP